jgi:site-specific DNA-methyltransferase (adenine-specific)
MSKVIYGDCLDEMKNIESKSIDMILCDLPYGITRCKWDSVIPLDMLWLHYKRIIKENGIIALTASQPFASALVMSNPDMFKHEWIWEKDGGSNFANTVREPMKEHETVLIFSKGKWTFNKQMQERIGSRKGKTTTSTFNSKSECYREFEERGVVKIPELRVPRSIQRFTRERGLHPTQKPVSLFEYLIKTYTNEGDLVLDNCAGSGTTGVACMNTNRNYILIEKEEKYIDTINNRLSKRIEGFQ